MIIHTLLFRIERIGYGKKNKTAEIPCDSVRREEMLDLINALIDLKEFNPKYRDRVSKQTWISKQNNHLMEKMIKRYDIVWSKYIKGVLRALSTIYDRFFLRN